MIKARNSSVGASPIIPTLWENPYVKTKWQTPNATRPQPKPTLDDSVLDQLQKLQQNKQESTPKNIQFENFDPTPFKLKQSFQQHLDQTHVNATYCSIMEKLVDKNEYLLRQQSREMEVLNRALANMTILFQQKADSYAPTNSNDTQISALQQQLQAAIQESLAKQQQIDQLKQELKQKEDNIKQLQIKLDKFSNPEVKVETKPPIASQSLQPKVQLQKVPSSDQSSSPLKGQNLQNTSENSPLKQSTVSRVSVESSSPLKPVAKVASSNANLEGRAQTKRKSTVRIQPPP